jgi:excisionase family DNA binding protein
LLYHIVSYNKKGGDEMERLLSSTEIAKIFNRTQLTVYRWVNAGLPHNKVGDGMKEVYRFNYEEVKEWLESTRKGGK